MSSSQHTKPSAKPRVVFLNRSYWPDAEATGQLLTELCADLVAAGWEVAVVAGQPNQNPAGDSFRARGTEPHKGVTIHRVWHTRFAKRSLLGRVINFISYLCGALLATLRMKRMDVLVVQTDPPLLCFVGAFARRWHRAKLVVYLQDIYPDLAVALEKIPAGKLTGFLRSLMFGVYRRAERVIVLSKDMRQLLIRSGVDESRVGCLPNWTDTRLIFPTQENNAFRAEHGLIGKFVVMYSGNMGLCQRLEEILDAASLLQDDPEIVLALVGDGALRASLESRVNSMELANVRFFPYQPKDRLAASLSAADVHLLPLDPRIAECLMPSKLYGVLASGSPLLTIAPAETELAEITLNENVGWVVAPGKPVELASAIRSCKDHPQELTAKGRRARQLAIAQYDRPRATARFAAMLSSVWQAAHAHAEASATTPALANAESMATAQAGREWSGAEVSCSYGDAGGTG